MTQDRQLVVVVDDDASVRKSLARLLSSAGYSVETFDSAEAFFAASHPDCTACAILDLAMPGMNGLELQARIVSDALNYGVVFLTGHGELDAGIDAMKQGAVDFLAKPVDEDRLLFAIENSLAEQAITRRNRAQTTHARSQFALLTNREREVMEYVVTGKLNKQIAAEMGISEKTVKAHRAQVMHKTGVGSLAGLVRMHIVGGRLVD